MKNYNLVAIFEEAVTGVQKYLGSHLPVKLVITYVSNFLLPLHFFQLKQHKSASNKEIKNKITHACTPPWHCIHWESHHKGHITSAVSLEEASVIAWIVAAVLI